MEKILISKCLLGENVRYDGKNNSLCQHSLMKRWLEEGRLVSVCPEVQAGLAIPRSPAEIIGAGGGNAVLKNIAKIVSKDGSDVTEKYKKGAEIALNVAQKHGIKIAILKDGSPSCGSSRIYDGSFSGTRISGDGITAALLRENGIEVFNENELEAVEQKLRSYNSFKKNQFDQTIGYALENWSPRQKPSKETMQGNYCILEPLDIDLHAEKLFAALKVNNQGETWIYLPYGPFARFNEFKNWLGSENSEIDPLFFVIFNPKKEQPLGLCSYLRINPEHGSIEVGHLHYSKLLQKTRASTEAMFLMMQKVFDEWQYRRYEWKCNALNQSSRAAAERLGFKFEGIFRQSHVFKGRNRDTAWYSIIDSEWPALKTKFQKWLDPSNFDSSGKQILSLQVI